MLEISDYIINVLENNSSLRLLMGSTSTDDRIYPYRYPSTVEWSKTKKGAIFWKSNQIPIPIVNTYPVQIGDIYFYFQCVSTSKTLSCQIEEILKTIFIVDNVFGFATSSYKISNVLDMGSSDGIDEGTPKFPLPSRILSILLTQIFKRNPSDTI